MQRMLSGSQGPVAYRNDSPLAVLRKKASEWAIGGNRQEGRGAKRRKIVKNVNEKEKRMWIRRKWWRGKTEEGAEEGNERKEQENQERWVGRGRTEREVPEKTWQMRTIWVNGTRKEKWIKTRNMRKTERLPGRVKKENNFKIAISLGWEFLSHSTKWPLPTGGK